MMQEVEKPSRTQAKVLQSVQKKNFIAEMGGLGIKVRSEGLTTTCCRPAAYVRLIFDNDNASFMNCRLVLRDLL